MRVQGFGVEESKIIYVKVVPRKGWGHGFELIPFENDRDSSPRMSEHTTTGWEEAVN